MRKWKAPNSAVLLFPPSHLGYAQILDIDECYFGVRGEGVGRSPALLSEYN